LHDLQFKFQVDQVTKSLWIFVLSTK